MINDKEFKALDTLKRDHMHAFHALPDYMQAEYWEFYNALKEQATKRRIFDAHQPRT